VAHEIELDAGRRFRRGFRRFRGCTSCVIPEWKTQLHGDRIPDRW